MFADQNQCLVPHLKDPLHICLEPENQGHGMTLNVCNLGSKYPYFNRAYLVSVKSTLGFIICILVKNLQMRATKTAAYYISPIEIGVL